MKLDPRRWWGFVFTKGGKKIPGKVRQGVGRDRTRDKYWQFSVLSGWHWRLVRQCGFRIQKKTTGGRAASATQSRGNGRKSQQVDDGRSW